MFTSTSTQSQIWGFVELEPSQADPNENGKTPLTKSSSERKKKSNNEKLPAAWGRTKMKMLHNKNSNNHKTTQNLGESAHVLHMSTIINDKKQYMDGKTKRGVEMHQIDLKNSQMVFKSKKMQYNALEMVNRSEAKKSNPSISQDKLNSLFPFESYE